MESKKTLCIALDASGSTKNKIPLLGSRIYEVIRQLGLEITIGIEDTSTFVLWNGLKYDIIRNQLLDSNYIRKIISTRPNTTEPSVIIEDKYMKHDLLVFVTDGEIESCDVTCMSEKVQSMKMLPTAIICIIVSNRAKTPLEENISVFASLMFRPCMVIHCDGQDNRLLWTNINETSYSIPDRWSDAKEVNIIEARNLLLKIENTDHKTMKLSNSVTVTENELFSMSKQELLKMLPCWETLIFYMRIKYGSSGTNKLRNLVKRAFVSNEKNVVLDDLFKKRMELVGKLKTQKGSKEELEKVDNQIKILSEDEYKFRHTKLDMLRLLCEHEKKVGDYSLGSVSSNRAARAQVVTFPPIFAMKDMECTKGTCSICMEDDIGLWLLVRSGCHMENTTDFVLNFPMVHDTFNQLYFKPLCFNCSLKMINIGIDPVRQPIIGALPLISKFPSDSKILQQAVGAWLFGRDIHVGWHLYVNALISNILRNPEQMENYTPTLNTLSNGIKTNDKLENYSVKTIPFVDAVYNLLNDRRVFMYQPLKAVLRLISLMMLINPIKLPVSGLKERVMKHIFETRRNKITTKEVCEKIFTISSSGVYDITSLQNNIKMEFLDKYRLVNEKRQVVVLRSVVPNITKRVQDALIYTKIYGNIHKAEGMYLDFCKSKPVYDRLDKKIIDNKHQTAPPFITLLGPSLMVCSCGKVCNDIDSFMYHMKQVYRGAVPNNNSKHSNIHRTIQYYFADMAKNDISKIPSILTRDHVVGILKIFFDCGIGNMCNNNKMETIVYAATSFLKVWKRTMMLDKKTFLEMFSKYNIGTSRFIKYTSRLNRLAAEKDLYITTDHPYYTLPTCDMTLAHPVTQEELVKYGINVPLPKLVLI